MSDLELITPTQIIRSKRKSISLIIKDNADFIVRAPVKTKDGDINKFINEKAKWIISKRKEQMNNIIKPITFNSDEYIPFLGQSYRVIQSDIKRVKISENTIVVPIEKSQDSLISFFKKQSRKYFSERIEQFCSMFGLKFNSISITSAKTCWGSCSNNNKIHFSYRLAFCPLDVIDYVIIHELCHTRYKNHGKNFWDLIKYCYPNYFICEKWLKKNRAIMNLI